MNESATVKLRVSRRFDAPPERVFDAWLDPAIARKWLFRTDTDEIIRAEIDARVGGGFTFVNRRGDEEIVHVGEYLEIDRPQRLVFSFAVPQFSPDYDRVTIEIVRLDKGCELTLTNEMAPAMAEEWVERTLEGWTKMLAGLSDRLEDMR
ncbi:MAG: SRPBCC domain-containing protein [Mesorhizobium sp.]|nr:SRPBCC domain-containing protein [Mesorhizobium sp.]